MNSFCFSPLCKHKQRSSPTDSPAQTHPHTYTHNQYSFFFLFLFVCSETNTRNSSFVHKDKELKSNVKKTKKKLNKLLFCYDYHPSPPHLPQIAAVQKSQTRNMMDYTQRILQLLVYKLLRLKKIIESGLRRHCNQSRNQLGFRVPDHGAFTCLL